MEQSEGGASPLRKSNSDPDLQSINRGDYASHGELIPKQHSSDLHAVHAAGSSSPASPSVHGVIEHDAPKNSQSHTENAHTGQSEPDLHQAHNHQTAPDPHQAHANQPTQDPHQAHSHRAAPDPHQAHVHKAAPGPNQAHAHHAASADHRGHEQTFRQKFWICLALSIPVLIFSPEVQSFLSFHLPEFPFSGWITPVFSIAVFIVGGLPFLRMAVPEIRNRTPGMMTLISMAISVAFVYSLAAIMLPNEMSFFWELVTLIDIMLLGHWIEMRSVRQASGALDELAKLMPDQSERIGPAGEIQTVSSSSLMVGDLLLVRPGASIPADGVVEEGTSDINESMITGESKPVRKHPGDGVIGGAINGSGSLRIRVTAIGDGTALAGIMRLVEQAQLSKSKTQVLADRAAGWLFYVALVSAAITGIAWSLAEGFNVEVIARVATVLVIACPHALGLAIPLVVAISTGIGARNGVLVRDRLALEKARELDIVIFDKTGTLTLGEFGVSKIAAGPGWSEDDALRLAAAIEANSEHTIAAGIRRTAQARGLEMRHYSTALSGFEALEGRGVRAMLDGKMVFVGGPRLLEMLQVEPPDELKGFALAASQRAESVIYLIQEAPAESNKSPDPAHQVLAAFALADLIRPESRGAVEKLHAAGLQVAMLTGDSQAVAEAVAAELGIDLVFAQVLPEHKEEKVRLLQADGKQVAMVGDGINDAPALSRADVGIAIGSGTDVAIESAGIILVRSDPLDVVKIFTLSRASYRKMVENLIWATGYNVIAIPLAAGALVSFGILLSPAAGALLMSLSTIIVALNAQLLRRVKL